MNKLKYNSSNLSLDRFVEHYSNGIIKPISFDDIPSKFMEKFEGYSRKFIELQEYIPRNFDNAFLIEHKNNYLSYLVSQEKQYSDNNKTVEKLIYIFDSTKDNEEIGHAEIVFVSNSKSNFFVNKPFPGYTTTEDKFLRKGYGINRLRMMNALSYVFFNYPLNSSDTIASNAQACWKKLVDNNEAKYYDCISILDRYPRNKKIKTTRAVFII